MERAGGTGSLGCAAENDLQNKSTLLSHGAGQANPQHLLYLSNTNRQKGHRHALGNPALLAGSEEVGRRVEKFPGKQNGNKINTFL